MSGSAVGATCMSPLPLIVRITPNHRTGTQVAQMLVKKSPLPLMSGSNIQLHHLIGMGLDKPAARRHEIAH